MQERFSIRAFTARSTRSGAVIAVIAVFMFGLAGCGSTAPTKAVSHPSTTVSQPLALTPAPGPRNRKGSARRTATAATKPAPLATASCPVGEKRTATGLCYSPGAQAKLVARLGPCLAGQVVADNGACQPLRPGASDHQPSLPARCRRPHRAGCIPQGSLQGGGLKTARGHGVDGIFH